jgi:hypothetical protein
MSFGPLGILAGAMGWVGAQYVYGQLSPTFKEQRPLLAASIVGSIVGLVVPAALNVLTTVMSK